MLGYNEMREVLVWVQTTQPAKVQIAYRAQTEGAENHFSTTTQTQAATAHTAKIALTGLEPGQSYSYQLLIDDQLIDLPYPTQFTTQALWQWRTDPPAFSMAVGSCAYVGEEQYDRPGTPYGGDYHIFTHIHKDQPDIMLWLGDNTYLREVDWHSRSGIQHRFTHTRSLAEMQPLLASTHHYAIWDDHDYGPNDSDRSYILKDVVSDIFCDFWGNPTCGIPQVGGGITTYFQYADADFFLLDNRYFRKPNDRKTGKPTVLGDAQLEWLIDALAFSRAPFKFVCIGGQVLNTAKVYETYTNLAPEERGYLLRRIEEEGITGVVFLTGDRHHTELSQYTNANGHQVYDLTVSPLTSGAGRPRTEVNDLRVKETLVSQRNYGLLHLSGPRGARELKIEIKDSEGELLWTRIIEEEKAD
jgi:alkaline phosphatase D